ncbi:MAG: aldehyde dehydrogenase [Candidatus Niyogibacteria bacterium]|nr:aldehyde dehydrogenase [Candidatus Niyogibacteria bacterium]
MTGETKKINHWIDGSLHEPVSGSFIERRSPATGEVVCRVAEGSDKDIEKAVEAAGKGFSIWKKTPLIERAKIIKKAGELFEQQKETIGMIIGPEAGLAPKASASAVMSVSGHAFFWAGEGYRFFGKTLRSKTQHRLVYMMREPIGIALIISPFNTPFGPRAIFPALLSGNAVIMKAPSDVPSAGIEFARILKEAGLPDGVFSVIQGKGSTAGALLIDHAKIDLVSFTGSVPVGKEIEEKLSKRDEKFVRRSLELGGKNALVICDDADMDAAVKSALSSAFSNAGQRCAAASRIIVFDSIYEEFRGRFVKETRSLSVGMNDDDFLGPVISDKQLDSIIDGVKGAVSRGAVLLAGGGRLSGGAYGNGYFVSPTILEGVGPDDEISRKELFGPVAVLYRVSGFSEALHLTNDSSYGLTAAIFTNSLHRAESFAEEAEVGTVHVNGNTYGSESHMPFGGRKLSGNYSREGGTEALDFYTQWKLVTVTHNPARA